MAMVWTVNNLKVSAIFSNNYSLISILLFLLNNSFFKQVSFALRYCSSEE